MYDFGKNKTVASLDDVPDNIKPFYEKADPENDESEFVLKQNDPVVGAAVGIIAAQQEIVKKERKASKGKAVDLTPLSAYGTTVEEITAGVEKEKAGLKSQIEDGGASVAKQIEEMKREMSTAHGLEVQKKDKDITNLTTQLDEHMLDTAIASAATEFNGLNPELIAPFARKRMKVDVDDAGQRRVVVLDGDGSVKFSMDRPGERASASELLEEMSKVASYQQLFPARQKQGSNLQPNNRSNNSRDKGEPKSPAEKISAGVGKLIAQGQGK